MGRLDGYGGGAGKMMRMPSAPPLLLPVLALAAAGFALATAVSVTRQTHSARPRARGLRATRLQLDPVRPRLRFAHGADAAMLEPAACPVRRLRPDKS